MPRRTKQKVGKNSAFESFSPIDFLCKPSSSGGNAFFFFSPSPSLYSLFTFFSFLHFLLCLKLFAQLETLT